MFNFCLLSASDKPLMKSFNVCIIFTHTVSLLLSVHQVTEDRPIAKSSSSEEEGLAGALAKALAARAGALKGSTYQ